MVVVVADDMRSGMVVVVGDDMRSGSGGGRSSGGGSEAVEEHEKHEEHEVHVGFLILFSYFGSPTKIAKSPQVTSIE